MEISFDSVKLKYVAAAFPTGITVITSETIDGKIQGMTANSFLSVSLDPPLVAFSIRNQASMFPCLNMGQAIGISILADHQEAISNQFAGRNDPPLQVEMTEISEKTHIINECLAWYATVVEKIIEAGDHYLILCKIINLDRAPKGNPLLYYSGYQKLEQ